MGRTASDIVYGAWQWLWGAAEPMEQAEPAPTAAENESVASDRCSTAAHSGIGNAVARELMLSTR
jgi:hypothetical protein